MKHDFLRRFGALILVLALAFSLAVTPAFAAGEGGSSVDIIPIRPDGSYDSGAHDRDTDTLSMAVGDTAKLSFVFAGQLWGGWTVAWTGAGLTFGTPTADETTVTASAAGDFTVTVTVTDKDSPTDVLTDTLTVKVTDDPDDANDPDISYSVGVSITDADKPLSLTVGGAGATLTATIISELDSAANSQITYGWECKPSSAVTIEPQADGSWTQQGSGIWEKTITAKVTPKAQTTGSATITLTVNAPGPRVRTAERAVTVGLADLSATGLSFARSPIQKNKRERDGDTWQQSVIVTPEGSTSEIAWEVTGDKEVASVAYRTGTTTTVDLKRGTKAGETEITASTTDKDGNTLTAKLKLIVSGIRLNTSSLEMTPGETETLSVTAFGEAVGQKVEWYPEDQAIVSVTGGRLTARAVGSTKITAYTSDGYADTCEVRVKEDSSSLVQTGTVAAGTPLSLYSLYYQMDSICREKTKVVLPDGTVQRYGLSYINNLSVATDQGILYYGYVSEADPGAGVGATEEYYANPSTGQLSMRQLSFVPRTTFSGNAEIRYSGWNTNGQSFTGVIRVPVGAVGAANGIVYAAGGGNPASFRADDFNTVCRGRTGRDLSYVTFSLPSSAYGTLYYGYSGQFGERVATGTQYRRNGTNLLDNVSFVPAQGYTGTVRISYRAVDTAGTSFTGQVTVNVTAQAGQGSVNYSGTRGLPVYFQANDFNLACYNATNELLSYVRFDLPAASEGTLYYNYYANGSYSSAVGAGTNYYRSGTPGIGNVCFVPANTASDAVSIGFTGYGTGGTSFAGTVYIRLDGTGYYSQTIQYTAYKGRPAVFQANDFNNASLAATGANLNYVSFQLPTASQGTLYYNYNTNSGTGTRVYAGTSYYRTGTGYLLNNVSFVASAGYAGTSRFSYTGYAVNGQSFTGTVAVQVTDPTPTDVNYSGSSSNPIQLNATTMRNACSPVMNSALSYIEITGLPSSTIGTLYANYNGYGTGSTVSVGSRYYCSGTPSIGQLYFVPRGKAQGTATVTYTGVSTSGERVSGRINFNITSSGTSRCFTDMGGYSWAAAAVDYLYQNDVTNGVAPGKYGPSQKMLRRDFVLMLCRAFHFSGGSGYSFADVPTNAYYSNAVATAKRLGIVNGDGGNFMPNSPITRQDAMVMIKNALTAAGWSLGSGTSVDLSRFIDSREVSNYARDAVGTLVRLGAVNGDERGRLNPRSDITRAEIAVILHFVMTM